MKAALATLAVVLLAACSSSSAPAAAVRPTPRPSRTTVASTPASGTRTAPIPDVIASKVGLSLSCRLPVTWVVPNQGGQETTQAGFVTFPNQTLAKDAAAPAGSLFYDRAFGKWLPVGRDLVSPDGRRYAYTKIAGNPYQPSGSSIYVVDVATGASRVIYKGGYAYAVIDFETEGVYLTIEAPEGYPHGLWFLDLAGDPPRLISGDIEAPAVGGGAAWGIAFNTADRNPAPGGLEGPRNEILRYDLRTGSATQWFYRSGSNVYPNGFDSYGRPVVTAYEGQTITDPNGPVTAEVWLVTGAGAATRIFSDATPGSSAPALAAVDRHGVWFDAPYSADGPSTLWLYTEGSMQMVAFVNRGAVAVAGGCIP